MNSNFIFFLMLWPVVKSEINIFPSLPVTVQNSNNDLCNRHSEIYLENLDNFTLWSYEMRDSSAQSATSILRGSGYSMGNLNQCLSANAPYPTQFCLAEIKANIPMTKTPRDPHSLEFDPNEHIINKLFDFKEETKALRNIVKMGWCIPASCLPADAEKSLNVFLKNYDHPLKSTNVSFSATVSPILCQSSDKQTKLDSVDMGFIICTAVLLFVVVAASILDSNETLGTTRRESTSGRILLAFSPKRTIRDLWKYDESDKPLMILYGIKTFSLLVIIAGHRLALFASSPLISRDYLEEHYRSTWSSALYHSDLFVDTFFFISGLLVTYILMDLIDKNKFKPGLMIIHRYLRLTPAYAFVIFFQATLLYHTGDGALWEAIVGSERQDCRANWWTGILYISNVVNSEHACLVQSWYLPCDFHYFLLALLLVYLLQKKKIIGLILIALCCLGTIAAIFYITYVYKKPPFPIFSFNFLEGPKHSLDFQLTYITTYTRGLPYFGGMFGGFIYYKLKGTAYKISQVQSSTILCITCFLISVLIFTGAIFYNPYHKYNAIEASFYGSLHRLLWALATLGFVYSISFSDPGYIYNFLSWDIFVPLSKLTYGAYLWHMGIQYRDIASTVNPRSYIFFDLFLDWISDTVLALFLAFVLYLTVEEPFRKIVRIFLIKRPNQEKKLEKTDLKIENSKL